MIKRKVSMRRRIIFRRRRCFYCFSFCIASTFPQNILKQWKKPATIYKNLMKLHHYLKSNIPPERIRGVVNARQVWYRRAKLQIVNYLITPEILSTPNKQEKRPGRVDSLAYHPGKT